MGWDISKFNPGDPDLGKIYPHRRGKAKSNLDLIPKSKL